MHAGPSKHAMRRGMAHGSNLSRKWEGIGIRKCCWARQRAALRAQGLESRSATPGVWNAMEASLGLCWVRRVRLTFAIECCCALCFYCLAIAAERCQLPIGESAARAQSARSPWGTRLLSSPQDLPRWRGVRRRIDAQVTRSTSTCAITHLTLPRLILRETGWRSRGRPVTPQSSVPSCQSPRAHRAAQDWT